MRLSIFGRLIVLAICQYLVLAGTSPQNLGERALQQRTPTAAIAGENNFLEPFSLGKRSPYIDGPDSAAGEPGHGGRRTEKSSPLDRHNFRIAHGTMMGSAFAVFFPLGAIFIRTLKPPGHVYIHAAMQMFATCLALAGMGVGIWLGLNTRYLDYAHTIIGFAVVASLSIQPILGLIHHLRYRKVQRSTWWGRIHRWFGRSLVVVGIVNGGLGLLLAENTKAGTIAYSIVAGISGLTWFVVVIWALFFKPKNDAATEANKMELTRLM